MKCLGFKPYHSDVTIQNAPEQQDSNNRSKFDHIQQMHTPTIHASKNLWGEITNVSKEGKKNNGNAVNDSVTPQTPAREASKKQTQASVLDPAPPKKNSHALITYTHLVSLPL